MSTRIGTCILIDSLSKKRDGIYKKAIPIILQKSMLKESGNQNTDIVIDPERTCEGRGTPDQGKVLLTDIERN